MTTGSGGSVAVAGGLARHIPVLGRRAVELLHVRSGKTYVDATFGAGGYTRGILATPDCRVVAIDRDPDAVAAGADLARSAAGRLVLKHGRFSELEELVRSPVDGIVFDLGVSSMQLDEVARGFSFRHDGPLDMRMERWGPSAADVVARLSERDLAMLVAVLGEEHRARAVARAIVAARTGAPIVTTRMLAEIVAGVVPARPGAIHPATRTFQALRIFVNEELDELAAGLSAAERLLSAGGRLVVVAFHSLEDRIVKGFLADRGRPAATSRHRPEATGSAPTFRLLTRRPEVPDDAEIAANPRARSAKLRAAERNELPASAGDLGRLLPRLPSLSDVSKERRDRGPRR